MDKMEAITVLSLGIGASGEHSKSRSGSGCKPKSPLQFHVLFPDQVPGETDQEDHENSDGHTRKKLRLSEEQLMVLETVYEEHCNLDPAVKQGLVKKLNIKPRQVEVWFQNRRARSKQKQTATDCENLKRRSEGLIRENQKLKRELKELMSISQHDNTHCGSNLVAMCSSCNKNSARMIHDTSKLLDRIQITTAE